MKRIFTVNISKRLTIEDICPEIADSYSLKPNRFTVINLVRYHHRETGQPSIVLKTFNKEDGYSNIFKNPIFVEYNLETKESHAYHV